MGGDGALATWCVDCHILSSCAGSRRRDPRIAQSTTASRSCSVGNNASCTQQARSRIGSSISAQVHEKCKHLSIYSSRFGQSESGSNGFALEKKCGSSSRSSSTRVVKGRRHAIKAESEAERQGWEKRKEEAGLKGQSIGGWQWTLNWDSVTPNLIIGSCPRSAGDIDRLVDEAGVSAILNLQSDLCVDALQIPVDEIRAQAVERGLFWSRVPIRDFDRGDQALMLPEAVRKLNLLLAGGHRVYCHCTAGINRASLSVLGYLTFVQGMSLDEGVAVVKGARSQAHPYLECWHEVERRLLDGRQEELTALAVEIYQNRCKDGSPGNADTDWSGARMKAAARSFERWLEVEQHTLAMQHDLLQASTGRQLAVVQDQLAKAYSALDKVRRQVENSRSAMEAHEVRLSTSEAELARTKSVLVDLLSQVAAYERAAAAAAAAAEAKAEMAAAAENASAAAASAAAAAAAAGAQEMEALAQAQSESKLIREAATAEAAAAEAMLSELEAVVARGSVTASKEGSDDASLTRGSDLPAETRELTGSSSRSSASDAAITAEGNGSAIDENDAESGALEEEEGDLSASDLECNVVTRECTSSSEDEQASDGEMNGTVKTESATNGVASSSEMEDDSVGKLNGSAVPSATQVPTTAGTAP